MLLSRFVILSGEDEEKAIILSHYGLGKIIKKQDLRCKRCSVLCPKEEITLINNFWKCPSGHGNKYNASYLNNKRYFEYNFNNIINVIENKLSSDKISKVNNQYLLYKNKDKEIPILFFDIPLNASVFIEGLRKGTFFIYVDEKEKNNVETTYTKKNFISLSEFLKTPQQELLKWIEEIAISSYPIETLVISKKIKKFIENNTYLEFEKEVVRLFDDLKNHESELTNLLSFLLRNKNNPSGNKFVHIGGNDPVDFYPIELFSYTNGILTIYSDKGYDAKMFTKKLTFQAYQDKKASNSGRKLVFITSAEDIDKKIWQDIKRAKENTGEWFYLVLDSDILSLFLYYIGQKNYFNLRNV